MVYIGVFQEAERYGSVTGNRYIFKKDKYGLPIALEVDERDKEVLTNERGKGCARRHPEQLFMPLLQWNIELESQRRVNR